MGLDMYAYAAANETQYYNFWESGEIDPDTKDYVNTSVSRPKELAYWRKHPTLHGWFQQQWKAQGNQGDFNGDQLEITWNMLERLEHDVKNRQLPTTAGFFFGSDASVDYYQQDLEFIQQARAELFLGLRVFYNSSW